MMIRDTFAAIAIGAAIFTTTVGHAQAPPAATADAGMSDTVSTLPALPALPADPAAPAVVPMAAPTAPFPAIPTAPTTAPTLLPPVSGTLPVVPGADPGSIPPSLPGVASFGGVAAQPAVPTPPPLGNLSAEASGSDSAAPSTSVPAPSAPSQLYTFLFIDDPENGLARHKFNADTAATLKETEISRLMSARMDQTNNQNNFGIFGAGNGITGFDAGYNPGGSDPNSPQYDPTLSIAEAGYGGAGPQGSVNTNNPEAMRAAAEWDFYYNQLEMYDHYVRDRLIPNSENLPTLSYDASNALQERQDLFESFQDAAINRGNEDFNDNRAFYERLQKREDRRIAYRQWQMHKQNQVAEWADVWAREINGSRWADGEEVRVDDWYYGTDFNSAKPVLVTMDDREYIVSREPVHRLQQGQLNVISSNLTPYDIIDGNGYLKNPVLETLRGTLVIPSVGQAYSTGDNTGTIEIVPGTPSE